MYGLWFSWNKCRCLIDLQRNWQLRKHIRIDYRLIVANSCWKISKLWKSIIWVFWKSTLKTLSKHMITFVYELVNFSHMKDVKQLKISLLGKRQFNECVGPQILSLSFIFGHSCGPQIFYLNCCFFIPMKPPNIKFHVDVLVLRYMKTSSSLG